MKQRQLFTFTLFLASLLCVQSAQAKVWRVNNNSGVNADFNSLTTAFATAAAGDTLYLEASATTYNASQSKRLTIIGPGYFLSGASGNPGLQANSNTATLSINLDSLGSGSEYAGLFFNSLNPSGGVDDIKVSRCYVGSLGTFSQGNYSNWKVTQCYLGILNMGYPVINWEITNNICTNSFGISTGQNCLVRNNTFNSNVNINSTYFANNIILAGSLISVNSTVKYNIASGANTLPAGNNNQNGIASNTIIVGTGSTDGQYQLKAGSPAIAAGETLNGITPDTGAFGTAAPYRLSGIPPIPTIYALTVPSSLPSNATSINVTLSTRSNN